MLLALLGLALRAAFDPRRRFRHGAVVAVVLGLINAVIRPVCAADVPVTAADAGAVHLRHQRHDVPAGGAATRRLRWWTGSGPESSARWLQPDLMGADEPVTELAPLVTNIQDPRMNLELSIEFFPPQTTEGMEKLRTTVTGLPC